MANNLFNRFGNNNFGNNNKRANQNILAQYRQLQNDPGAILDILLNNGKINQSQYNDLQQYRNNPQQIFNYIANNGNSAELNQISNFVKNMINTKGSH